MQSVSAIGMRGMWFAASMLDLKEASVEKRDWV